MTIENKNEMQVIKSNYKKFIDSCACKKGFKLTTRSEVSPYALCFAIFGYHLIRDQKTINYNKERWVSLLIKNLDSERKKYENPDDLIFSKPYLQLLTFSLSALKILNSIDHSSIKTHIIPLLDYDIEFLLKHKNISSGAPGSGNMAMFWGIILIHAKEILNIDTNSSIRKWVKFHKNSMNQYGFWGSHRSMNYLMFQNGYHQYEILDYLGLGGSFWTKAAKNVDKLKDNDFRFAPYPGGGGCYDYDALYILTSTYSNKKHSNTIRNTFITISMSQNLDGGFCESKYIRPRSYKNFKKSFLHFFSRPGENKLEVLKRIISIQRPKHNKIHTHWTRYSREWGESDLWDSWFRVLLLARIEVYFDKTKFKNWGFIDYPGIGFHHIFHEK